MKVLIAGGSGFLGSALVASLRAGGHEAWILTRRHTRRANEIHWDGKTVAGWGEQIREMDAIVNVTGFGLEHWPWTRNQKRRFHDSRVLPGRALVAAVEDSARRPGLFLQISGINYYGLRGDTIADETTPPGDDYLSQLAVQWEAATRAIEGLGVRRVIARTAVVLDVRGGMFPLLALPVRLFFGGRLGKGDQALPWIHLSDATGALRFLLEKPDAEGIYNLIAPAPTSNAEFMRAIAKALHRPYWFPVPTSFLRTVLGEMSVSVTEGRYSWPARLLEAGYQFQFPTIDDALRDLFH